MKSVTQQTYFYIIANMNTSQAIKSLWAEQD